MTLLPSTITRAQFAAHLSHYPATVSLTPSLAALDSWRLDTLPKLISERTPPHLLSSELYQLVTCKLKRGKNRPILHLIASNSASTVIAVTTAAFAAAPRDLRTALTHLLLLRGVGPATASYLLAARCPDDVPVFSDEAFRWLVGGEKMKYSEKEFWTLYEMAGGVAERLGVSREEVEKVGFVVGQEAGDMVEGKTKAKAKEGKKRKIVEPKVEKEDKRVKVETQRELGIDTVKERATSSGRVLRSRKGPAAGK